MQKNWTRGNLRPNSWPLAWRRNRVQHCVCIYFQPRGYTHVSNIHTYIHTQRLFTRGWEAIVRRYTEGYGVLHNVPTLELTLCLGFLFWGRIGRGKQPSIRVVQETGKANTTESYQVSLHIGGLFCGAVWVKEYLPFFPTPQRRGKERGEKSWSLPEKQHEHAFTNPRKLLDSSTR